MILKRFILGLILIIICIGFIFCVNVFRNASDEISSNEMEDMRDQLKVYQDTLPVDESNVQSEDSNVDETVVESDRYNVTIEYESEEREESSAETAAVSVSNSILDFEKMQKINPDIYAWIEIKDTKVDYPVLQNANDEYYLSIAHDGSPYVGGAIFTQATYNKKDFNDPVTILYGHTMRSGILFGQLQAVYSDYESFQTHNEIIISLPNEERKYTVFAAVPYDSIHILHVYDFENEYWYNNFFKNVRKIRDFGANFNDDAFPEAGDRVIILSTCLQENSSKRFLVMAILQSDLDDN